MGTAFPLIVALLTAPAEPQFEPLPAAARQVLDKYLKAVEAKDLKAMAALADVPWLDRDRKVVRDRADLAKALERVASQLPVVKEKREAQALPYKKNRERLTEAAERKLFDDVLGDDGWLVTVEEDGYPLSVRMVLIRVKGDKAAVVAGPLKQNQVSPRNRVPEAVDRLLDRAATFEVYSLDPNAKADKAAPGTDTFHNWVVLGKTEVKNQAERKKLADAMRLGAEDNFGMAAGCFIPRHGVRLKAGDKTVDLVICFQCLSVQVFADNKDKDGFLITSDPQKAFDAVLKAANVKLPKPADE